MEKTSIKGHYAFWKSKQSSDLLSTSHYLGSKYAYNVCKRKAKFWLRPSLLVDENSLYFSNENRYIAEVYLIGWLSVTSQARFFPNNKKVFVFSKE